MLFASQYENADTMLLLGGGNGCTRWRGKTIVRILEGNPRSFIIQNSGYASDLFLVL